jgi:hypothetical protein
MEAIKNKWIDKTKGTKEPEAKKRPEAKDPNGSPYSFAARANYKSSLRGIRK